MEKHAEAMRSQLAQADTQQRAQTLAQADAIGRLQAQLDTQLQANHQLAAAAEKVALEVRTLRAQLADAQREALQHKTEAAAVRELVERLAPPSAAATKTSRSAKRAS